MFLCIRKCTLQIEKLGLEINFDIFPHQFLKNGGFVSVKTAEPIESDFFVVSFT